MAAHAYRLPEAIENFNDVNWKQWKQKFQIYLRASKNNKEDDETKIAILLNSLGDEGIAIFNTFEEKDQQTLDLVLAAFDQHVIPKRNATLETFKFKNIVQKDDQPIESFLTELKTQAQLCAFTCMKEECSTSYAERMIRDQLIIGILDKQVQQRLIREPDLDFTKIVNYCKSIEISKQNIKILNPGESVDIVRKITEKKKKCSRCLYEHVQGRCPAFNKTCAACKGRNHFAKACMKVREKLPETAGKDDRGEKKFVRQIWETEDTDEDVPDPHNTLDEELFLFAHRCLRTNNKSWHEELQIGGCNIKFKLDTGAETSVLPKNKFMQLHEKFRRQLQPSKVTLVCYANFKFKPLGEVNLPCRCKEKEQNIRLIIVDVNSEPLLGLDDCIKFGLVSRIDTCKTELTPVNKEIIYKNYKNVFQGLGQIPGTCSIELTDDYKPIIQCQRKVPYALHDRLKKTLLQLEQKNVISQVNYPTEWVNSLMIVEKPDKSLRVCLDPKPLNKYIKRQHFLIPTNNDIICRLSGKTIFSVIDMRDGFWQIVLDEESSKLCTFNTPFGRYKFNRLPFGISSAPEIFQQKNNQIFGDIDGVDIYFDDIIISGKNNYEHDKALKLVLERALQNNVKFNFNKFQYKLSQVKFMGQIISSEGVRPDDGNIKAVMAIENPKNKQELLRVLGMLKFFSKFIPNLSALTSNLRELTKNDTVFNFTKTHESELDNIKKILTTKPTLKIYDPVLETTIQCDASSEGLGCCLLQLGHPIAFASRSLTTTEKRYAQIEKELLSIVFAFEKFHNCVYGREVNVHTDHKPLIPIFKKNLDKVTSRLQRMLLRLLKYDIKLEYLPGKDMYVADTLSRAFIKLDVEDDPEMEYIIHSLSNNIPMSNEKKVTFAKEINKDPVLAKIKHFCETKWPDTNKNLQFELQHYYKLKDDIYLSNNLLFLNEKVIVPMSLRAEMLKLIHEPHFGIVKTKLRARQALYWPKMSTEIENLVSNCNVCQMHRKSNSKEPLINYPLPNRPWQFLHSDIFEYKTKNYIVLTDAYSNWIEVAYIKNKTAEEVIVFLKNTFSKFGVPDIFYADNVPYNSKKLKAFASDWNFELEFSSPYHHQSNGLAEKSVDIVKRMLIKNENNLSLSLMEYRNTPLPTLGYSPAQLLLNRMLKTKIPTSLQNLKHNILDSEGIKKKLEEKQNSQKYYYGKNTRQLSKFKEDDSVMLQKGKVWVGGRIRDVYNERAYMVEDVNGNCYRRNRKFLNKAHGNISSNSNYLMYDDVISDSNVSNSGPSTSDPLSVKECNNQLVTVPQQPVIDLNSNVSSSDISTGTKMRNRKPPMYLLDYETNIQSGSDDD